MTRDRVFDAMADAATGAGVGVYWLCRWAFAAAWLACVVTLPWTCRRADAAPVPFPRPAPCPLAYLTAGTLEMDYDGTAWRCAFLSGGEYACWREGGPAFIGTWRAEGGRALVTERALRPGEPPGAGWGFDFPLTFGPRGLGGPMGRGGSCHVKKGAPDGR